MFVSGLYARLNCVQSSELNDDKSAFNYFFSKLRNHVEQVFGMLVAKWPIFEAPLRYRVRKSISIVYITMRLHKFCVDNRSDLETLHY